MYCTEYGSAILEVREPQSRRPASRIPLRKWTLVTATHILYVFFFNAAPPPLMHNHHPPQNPGDSQGPGA